MEALNNCQERAECSKSSGLVTKAMGQNIGHDMQHRTLISVQI